MAPKNIAIVCEDESWKGILSKFIQRGGYTPESFLTPNDFVAKNPSGVDIIIVFAWKSFVDCQDPVDDVAALLRTNLPIILVNCSYGHRYASSEGGVHINPVTVEDWESKVLRYISQQSSDT